MKLFFENFDKLAEAPGGVKKLREMILQMAVQGKLVPQDPKDEPASVLLEKIKAEKERLLKEGKIRKQKPLEPIKESEIPFEVPEGWEWVQIGDIGKIFNGNSINASIKNTKYSNLSEGFPYIATKDVGYGRDDLRFSINLF